MEQGMTPARDQQRNAILAVCPVSRPHDHEGCLSKATRQKTFKHKQLMAAFDKALGL
jgi:hypothetical protein